MKTGSINIIIEDGKTPSVEAELVNGNLWMGKYDIAKLFNCFPQKVEANLRSIFKNRLLWEEEVSQTYRYTDKGIEKQTVYFNLEVLIFLSYRIVSFEAQIFRQFVNAALRELLQKQQTRETLKMMWYFRKNQNYWLN